MLFNCLQLACDIPYWWKATQPIFKIIFIRNLIKWQPDLANFESTSHSKHRAHFSLPKCKTSLLICTYWPSASFFACGKIEDESKRVLRGVWRECQTPYRLLPCSKPHTSPRVKKHSGRITNDEGQLASYTCLSRALTPVCGSFSSPNRTNAYSPRMFFGRMFSNKSAYWAERVSL